MDFDFKVTDKFNPAYLGFVEVVTDNGLHSEATINGMDYRIIHKTSLMDTDTFVLEYAIKDYHDIFGTHRPLMTITRDTWDMLMDRLERMVGMSGSELQSLDQYAAQCLYDALLRKTKISRLLDGQ